jgi:DNA-binding CsgD family transcriptional regulator
MELFRAVARDVLPAEELMPLESPEHQDLRVQIEVARSLLTSHGFPSGGSLDNPGRSAPGEGEVLLAKVERAAAEGRFPLIASMLEGMHRGEGNYSPETVLQLKVLLALADAITDRQHEALALAEEITATLQHLLLPPKVRGRLILRVQLIFLITGKTESALSGTTQDLPLVSGDGTAGELMDGVALALNGRDEDALVLLVPALAQLHVRDPGGLRCMAAAATAYCHALRGDFDRVRPLMMSFEEQSAEVNLPQFALRYFRALTLALLGSADQAVSMLEEQAESEREAGRFGLELLARAAVLRLTGKPAVRPLLSAVSRTQGPFSALYSVLCEGLTTKDPHLLLKAVRKAETMGNYRLAAEITESARAMAVASGDRKVVREVRSLLGASGSRLEDMNRERPVGLLTPRETEVAGLVKMGFSNKEIAGRMHVSIRTVEGHMYQIYVKLGVSNRSDLLAALDDAAS